MAHVSCEVDACHVVRLEQPNIRSDLVLPDARLFGSRQPNIRFDLVLLDADLLAPLACLYPGPYGLYDGL